MTYYKNETILTAESISLKLGEKEVLRDINFSVHNICRPGLQQGQVVSLIGRSGIGKTQLFRIIAGLQQPDTGTLKIGRDLHPVKQGEVGIVPQNYILFNHRSIYENLQIGLRASGKESVEKERKEIIQEYAGQFMLKEHLHKYPQELSGGQRQRVSIIQQVLTGNQFILLDEPFSGLDTLMIDKVVDLLVKISNLHEYNTLVIVSHDIENALAISDTAFILAAEKGKEGATITETIDLVEMGLAWRPDIRKDPCFLHLLEAIKYKL